MFENNKKIKIDDIMANENVRRDMVQSSIFELMQSIKHEGLLEPIGVYPSNNGKYEVAYGFRRFLALKKLGWKELEIGREIIVTQKESKKENMIIDNLIENELREDITPIELGAKCVQLKKVHGMNELELSARTGISVSKIKTAISLFNNVPDEFKSQVTYKKAGTEGKKKHGISSTVADQISKLRLKRPEIAKIFSHASRNNSTSSDIVLIESFLRNGATVEEAIREKEKYSFKMLHILVNKEEFNKLQKLQYHKLGSFDKYIVNVLSGKMSMEKNLLFRK